MLPSVSITKAAFALGTTTPQPTGQLAIIAASLTGTQNVASSYARDDLVLDDFGYGPLSDYASYCLQIGKKSIVAVRPATSQAAAYGSVTKAGTGTSAATASGVPADEYDFLVTITKTVTIGSSGGQYTYSLDGGVTTSGVQSIPATSPAVLSITEQGKQLAALSLGAGNVQAGDTYQAFTTRALANNADLPAALDALTKTRQGWEGVLIDCVYTTGTVGVVDTWLSGLEANGQFHFALLNTRHKTQPVPTAESESAFATAMQTLTSGDASDRMCVGTDAADLTSTLTGISQPRPVSLFLAARAMLIPVGEDPAFVGRGALPNASISDSAGNPRWHDEDLYPTLDGLRLTTLRSFAPGGPQGVYICNANILGESGSDFVWLQHLRTMNLACSIVWKVLTSQLSIGLAKQAPDPNTGAVYILPSAAQKINGLCNSALTAPLRNQVTAVQFTLAQDDDLSSNSTPAIHGTVEMVSLAYGKNFDITSSFSKGITVGGS